METWIAQHFLNPAYVLAGAALVAAPIVIHLINRLRYRRVAFAAMEFLLVSQKRNRRRVLLEQLLLLLLRILIVLAIVALIARLILDPSELNVFQGARSHHVVLLDDSGSMRDRLDDGTAFEEGLEIARKLVAEGARRPGTQKFTLIRLSQPDQPLFTQRSVDDAFLVELDTKLRNITCSHQSLSLPAGFDGARNVLLEDRAAIRYLHVISDFRNSDWQDQQSLRQTIGELDSAGVVINFVRTVGRRNQNLGITSLTGDVQVASAGVPVRLTVAIRNFSDQVVSSVGLRVVQDGQKLPLTVSFDKVEAGVEVTQDFDLIFDAPGRHRVDVTLPPDALDADNQRFLSVDVAPVNRVLIIEGNPSSDEGEYLADALAADPGITGYSPQLETVDFLRRRSLDGFQSIFMLNVAAMPDDALAPLEDYVRAGGGLAWFLGDEIRPAYYISKLYAGGGGLFPVRLGIVSARTNSSSLEGAPDTEFADHPAFQVFQGQENPFTELTRVFEYFPVADDWEPDDQRRGDAVRTIAWLTSRAPLAFSSTYGSGRVVTFLTSCGPRWNNWARYPSFVAMMLDLEKFIARRDRVPEQRIVGEPIELTVDPNQYLDEIEIIGPDATGNAVTRLKAAPPRRGTGDGPDTDTAPEAGPSGPSGSSGTAASEQLTARFRDTDTPGIYQVRLLDQNQSPVDRWITFNVPVAESELELAPTDLIRRQLGGSLDVQIQEPGEFSWIAGRDAGQEVRLWLLVALVLFLFAEQLLGYRLSFHTREH